KHVEAVNLHENLIQPLELIRQQNLGQLRLLLAGSLQPLLFKLGHLLRSRRLEIPATTTALLIRLLECNKERLHRQYVECAFIVVPPASAATRRTATAPPAKHRILRPQLLVDLLNLCHLLVGQLQLLFHSVDAEK